jgi:hypothetical protein
MKTIFSAMLVLHIAAVSSGRLQELLDAEIK